jgi:eukaryotic-like serine/threonine-protein kinase
VTLSPGDRVGPYSIVALLGAGGMGEVYRAHDAKLGRDVAIKVLPGTFTADAERLARFDREARALAALNHPNVGAIYGIQDAGSGCALVLELVEGPTLADKLRSPLPVHEAVRIAAQIANAVDAAHKKGIVHRDLKPANIKVNPEGTVKVLDFGLAKISERAAVNAPQSATVTASGTIAGAVLGTVGYMSPEQARGDLVDERTDVWAIGCILYEMLAGRRAFDGRTSADTIARVLDGQPDWSALPRDTPPAVRDLLARCLKKDATERIQDMSGVRALLEWATVSGKSTKLSPVVVAGAGMALVVAGSLAAYRWFDPEPAAPSDASHWEQLTDFADSATQPSLSADGRMLAFIRGDSTFATPGQIYLKHLPDGEPTALTRDEHVKMDPVFSPDGNRLAYTVSGRAGAMATDWNTWEIPVVRGEPRLWLANAAALTWTAKGQILFSQIKSGLHMGIVTASETRSGARELYFPAHENGMAHRSALSPGGQSLLVAEMNEAGMFTSCRLIPATGEAAGRTVGPSGRCTNVAWSPDGGTMYFTADAGEGAHIWQQRFPDGVPEQLTISRTTQEEGLAVTPDGRSIITSVGQQRRGVWIHDASGERQISREGYAYWPLLSADGRKVSFRVSRGPAGGTAPTELWVTELDSGRFDRLFPGQTVIQYDLSRDDQLVAVVGEPDGKNRLWAASLDGGVPPRGLGIEASAARIGAGGMIVYSASEAGVSYLFQTDMAGSTPKRLTSQPTGNVMGTISPDGAWVTDTKARDMAAISTRGAASVPILQGTVSRMRWASDGTRALIAVQSGAGASAFGFGRTYVMPLEPGSTLPRMPAGGFKSEAELAAWPGVQVLPYGDLAVGAIPGLYAYSKITVTRNLYRIPLR